MNILLSVKLQNLVAFIAQIKNSEKSILVYITMQKLCDENGCRAYAIIIIYYLFVIDL